MKRRPPRSTLFPCTTLFRSAEAEAAAKRAEELGIDVVIASPLRRTRETAEVVGAVLGVPVQYDDDLVELDFGDFEGRSEEHTSELQSRQYLVCRLLLENKMQVDDDAVVHRHDLPDDPVGIVLANHPSISDYAKVYSHSNSIVEQRDCTNVTTVTGDGAR